MTNYTAIADTEIDKDSPVTAPVMTRLRDNPVAISEGGGPAPSAGEVVVLCFGHGRGEETDIALWTHTDNGGEYTDYSSENDYGRGSVTIYRAGTYRVRFAGIGNGGTGSGNNTFLTLNRKPVGSSVEQIGGVSWDVPSSGTHYVAFDNSGDDYIDLTVGSGDHFYFIASCRNGGQAGPVFLSFCTDKFIAPVGV
jgi:hypothetical protein